MRFVGHHVYVLPSSTIKKNLNTMPVDDCNERVNENYFYVDKLADAPPDVNCPAVDNVLSVGTLAMNDTSE